VPFPPSTTGRNNGCIPLTLGKQSSPWAFQPTHKLHADLNVLHRPGFHRPDYVASCFFLTSFHSNRVADLQFMLNPAEKPLCNDCGKTAD